MASEGLLGATTYWPDEPVIPCEVLMQVTAANQPVLCLRDAPRMCDEKMTREITPGCMTRWTSKTRGDELLGDWRGDKLGNTPGQFGHWAIFKPYGPGFCRICQPYSPAFENAGDSRYARRPRRGERPHPAEAPVTPGACPKQLGWIRTVRKIPLWECVPE